MKKIKRKFPFIGNRERKENQWKKMLDCKKTISCKECYKTMAFKALRSTGHKPKIHHRPDHLREKTVFINDEFWDYMGKFGVMDW